MCATCGCSSTDARHDDGHDHGHDHGHHHHHESASSKTSTARTIQFEQAILAKNDHLAAHNRADLKARGIFSLNLMSSPGAGKTTLLERTIQALGGAPKVGVIEGDQETSNDADRIRAAGAEVVQINTGQGCHLDAAMVAGGLRELDPPTGSLLVIENVGNLVCPALFDLGEAARVVIASVTEGEDKPLKYPHMFRAADLLVVNKVDLLPHLDFDLARLLENARRVNPEIEILEVSATRGTGLDAWVAWLRARTATVDVARAPAP